ncbi:MAG: RIP metalloprotease RseP [Bradymonadaceae bacterium]
MSIVYFIVLIGALIFIHEFGHFIVAKIFDVRVLRFSIGFGPEIVSYQRGETEYVLAMLPLGGYVQMYGHTFEDIEELDPEERDRALMGKPVWQRSLITLAGPAFNILLPLVIYFTATALTPTAPPSEVGQVLPETPAAEAGLQPGDRIVAIDGESTRYWSEVTSMVRDAWNRTVTLTVERNGERRQIEVNPEKKTRTDFLGLNTRTYGMLGIHRGRPGPTIALDDPDGPAARAGLKHFDRIVAIDGEPVRDFHDIRTTVRNHPGEKLELLVLRRYQIGVEYGQFFRQRTRRIRVAVSKRNGRGRIGIEPAQMYVTEVDPSSPAARAGLQSGDRLVALDGRTYGNWRMLVEHLHNDINRRILDKRRSGEDASSISVEFELTWERGEKTMTGTIQPRVVEYEGQGKQSRYRIYVGWGHFNDMVMPDRVRVPLLTRLEHGVRRSVSRTWELTSMMVTGLLRLAQGRVSLDTVGGPIMIGELAAQAGRAGFEYFFQMMALISINLAIINLLPIPVLDGGHLMFYAVEAVRRRPLSFRTRQILTYIGFVLIVLLMLYATKNDIERYWHQWMERLSG